MNKKEYQEKRKELMNQAEEHIKLGDAEKAENTMEEARRLDEQYENEKAYEEPEPIMMPWMRNGGEGVNFNSCKFQEQEKIRNTIYLKGRRGMENFARSRREEKKNQNNETTHADEEGALEDIIRGVVTGQWKNKELKNEIDKTSSGVLIPQIISGRIIDVARELSLFSEAGVPIVPMTSDNATISRVKTDPIFSFKEEGKEGKEASFELDGVKLESKTCYGYAYITLEAIKSSLNLENIVTQVFAAAIANSVDKAMLYGQKDSTSDTGYAAYAPEGIMNDKDVLSVTADNGYQYDDIIRAAGAIRKNNAVPTVWAINSDTEEGLELLKTTDGQYLNPPKKLEEMRKIVSNQLKSDETAGSDALVFDPQAMVIGIQNNIQIKIIEDEKCLKNGLVGFQIYTMQDCKVVRPKSICKIAGMGKTAAAKQ